MNVNIKIDSINKILTKRGLNANGHVQRFFTNEVARYANPYTPFKTGNLKDTQVRILPDQIKYIAPYAEKQYYNNSGMGKEGINKGGLRGKLWISRMWVDHGNDIVKSVATLVGGESK